MMKKYVMIWMLAISVLGLSCMVYATNLEGTVMPPKGHWKMGFQYLSIEDQNIDYLEGAAESHNGFYTLQYGFNDVLTFDFKLGAGDVDYRPEGQSALDYQTHFAGGYGLRLKPHDNIVLGAHHISVHPYGYGDDTGLDQKIIWDDWQLDGLVFKKFGVVAPYAGVKGHRMFLIRKVNGDRQRMKSDFCFGPALGFDMAIPGEWVLNAEWSGAGSSTWTVGISHVF